MSEKPLTCVACDDLGILHYTQRVQGAAYRDGAANVSYAAACLCQRGLRYAKPYGGYPRIDQIFSVADVEREFFPQGIPQAVAIELSETELERVGLPAKMRRWTFRSFPDQKHPQLAKAKTWVAAAGHRMLLMHGPPGTGKTGLAVAMLRELLTAGRSVKFVAINEFLPQLQATFNTKRGDGESEFDVLLPAFAPYLLVLDDLNARRPDPGTRRMSAYLADVLQLIVNKREGMEKPTILTTNMNPEVLEDYLPNTLYDRLHEGEFWEFEGKSKRKPRVLPFSGQRSAKRRTHDDGA